MPFCFPVRDTKHVAWSDNITVGSRCRPIIPRANSLSTNLPKYAGLSQRHWADRMHVQTTVRNSPRLLILGDTTSIPPKYKKENGHRRQKENVVSLLHSQANLNCQSSQVEDYNSSHSMPFWCVSLKVFFFLLSFEKHYAVSA